MLTLNKYRLMVLVVSSFLMCLTMEAMNEDPKKQYLMEIYSKQHGKFIAYDKYMQMVQGVQGKKKTLQEIKDRYQGDMPSEIKKLIDYLEKHEPRIEADELGIPMISVSASVFANKKTWQLSSKNEKYS